MTNVSPPYIRHLSTLQLFLITRPKTRHFSISRGGCGEENIIRTHAQSLRDRRSRHGSRVFIDSYIIVIIIYNDEDVDGTCILCTTVCVCIYSRLFITLSSPSSSLSRASSRSSFSGSRSTPHCSHLQPPLATARTTLLPAKLSIKRTLHRRRLRAGGPPGRLESNASPPSGVR